MFTPPSLSPGGEFYSFGSISYPGPTAPTGQVPFPPANPTKQETGEPIPVAPQAGARVALTQVPADIMTSGRGITYEVEFDVAPGTAQVSLQAANRDVDEEYFTIDTLQAIVTTRARSSIGLGPWLFIRLRLDSITPGAATTIIGKIFA
jgi:hypothetical protein